MHFVAKCGWARHRILAKLAKVIKSGDTDTKKLLEDAQAHAEAALVAAKKDYETAKNMVQSSELRSYVQAKFAAGKDAAVALVEEIKKEATQVASDVKKEANHVAEEAVAAVEKATAPVKRTVARKAPAAKKPAATSETPVVAKRTVARKAPAKKAPVVAEAPAVVDAPAEAAATTETPAT